MNQKNTWDTSLYAEYCKLEFDKHFHHAIYLIPYFYKSCALGFSSKIIWNSIELTLFERLLKSVIFMQVFFRKKKIH